MVSNIYDVITPLPFDPQGWFYTTHAESLKKLIPEQNIKTIIEVGSWKGLSTRYMANLLPEDGKLIAVDTWQGSEESEHIEDPILPQLYQQFLSNVIHTNLTDKIIPVRMSSEEAAKAIDIKADLIYIDASHDEENVYKDISIWYPKLKENGIFCGDDYNDRWPGVYISVSRFAAENSLAINLNHSFWWYSKIG